MATGCFLPTGRSLPLAGAISDRFVEELTAIGDEQAVHSGIRRYREAGASSPSVGPVAKTDVEATSRAAISA